MKKIIYIGTFFLLTILVLTGCSEDSDSNELTTSENTQETSTFIDKEIILNMEDSIMIGQQYFYAFTGFSNDDTITFKSPGGYSSVTLFYPVKKGYTIQFKELKGLDFTIIDFNRDKGFVKLQVKGSLK